MDDLEVQSEVKDQAKPKSSRGNTKRKKTRKPTKGKSLKVGVNLNFPKHSLPKILRIPKAIFDQNAGKECLPEDVALFLGVSYRGPFQVEISSAKKYGLIENAGDKKIRLTGISQKILRPQSPEDYLHGMREAVMAAPTIGQVYAHYRGENLPDRQFLENALVDNFEVPADRVTEFIEVFHETLSAAELLDKKEDKFRVIDVSAGPSGVSVGAAVELKRSLKPSGVGLVDTCFVMMPFANPIGSYYTAIYEPAINKAGLKAIRADNEIFGTGKIIDQIWSGINSAKVLVAELTSRNANVFYELGLAHALKKPVVLISANEADVPFDLKHVRVIYYDVTDPFWGQKLIDKVAENILSAIGNPAEAILYS